MFFGGEDSPENVFRALPCASMIATCHLVSLFPLSGEGMAMSNATVSCTLSPLGEKYLLPFMAMLVAGRSAE